MSENTYLELSEGTAHKFYEIIVNGVEVSVRYGRIGDPGQKQVTTYPTVEKAMAEAHKKINEKMKKGYERAVQGIRKKRAVTSRSAMMQQYSTTTPTSNNTTRSNTSNRATTKAAVKAPVKQLPISWKFNSGASALGIFIDESLCWVGNEQGNIIALDHSLEVRARFKLPDGVKSIVADDDWLYAGCDDGNVYDLSGNSPRLAYEIAENIDIYWIDIKDGILAVSDSEGRITIINHEDESQWSKKSRGDKAWMVRCDEIGVYHGHSKGVTMYDWEDGREIWSQPTDGWIGFGWQEESTVYASTANAKVYGFTKKGELETIYQCDNFLCSCATAENGKFVFAGDSQGNIYCFNQKGDRLWKLNSGCGAAQSMQFFQDKLYIVTNHGFLACIDVSETAINLAQTGVVPEAKAPTLTSTTVAETTVATTLETTSDTTNGILVECFREGSNLRVRVISPGYKQDWNCQFPKDIREEGARYLVNEVRESAKGGFYRVLGNIKKISS